MGLNLSGKSSKKKKVIGSGKSLPKQNIKSTVDDEEIVASGTNSSEQEIPVEETASKREVLRISSFEGGFVHSAFREAVNAGWIKSSESAILLAAVEECLVIDGLAVGLISARSSFERKQGGSVLF